MNYASFLCKCIFGRGVEPDPGILLLVLDSDPVLRLALMQFLQRVGTGKRSGFFWRIGFGFAQSPSGSAALNYVVRQGNFIIQVSLRLFSPFLPCYLTNKEYSVTILYSVRAAWTEVSSKRNYNAWHIFEWVSWESIWLTLELREYRVNLRVERVWGKS